MGQHSYTVLEGVRVKGWAWFENALGKEYLEKTEVNSNNHLSDFVSLLFFISDLSFTPIRQQMDESDHIMNALNYNFMIIL